MAMVPDKTSAHVGGAERMGLRDKKVLVTGASGQIAFALCQRLAQNNEVWGIARFRDEQKRTVLDAAGVRTRVVDIADPDYSALPDDFDHVVHLAIYQGESPDTHHVLEINAIGTGKLLSHFRAVQSAFVMSTSSVYAAHEDPWHRYVESDPIGGAVKPGSPTYSVTKVAQEAVARFCAEDYGLPVVIGRMDASYGPGGGLPTRHLDLIVAGEPVTVRADPLPYSPIHDEDIAGHLAGLLDAASAPATIVNFGGDVVVTAQQWCRYFGELAGRQAIVNVEPVPGSRPGNALDVRRRQSFTGPDRVHWQDGMRAMYEARHGERG